MRRVRESSLRWWFLGVFALSTLALLLAWRSFTWLDEAGRNEVYKELVKLAYQFLVIVLLGALLKKIIDDSRDRRAKQEQQMEQDRNDEAHRRERQRSYVRRLVNESHAVELARMLVLADRSVKTWSRQMNERVIVAYLDLRDMRHDAETAIASGDLIFHKWPPILRSIQRMEAVLKALIDEYRENRKKLSELELNAAKNRSLQDKVWEDMLALPFLRDLLAEQGEKFGQFRLAL